MGDNEEAVFASFAEKELVLAVMVLSLPRKWIDWICCFDDVGSECTGFVTIAVMPSVASRTAYFLSPSDRQVEGQIAMI